MKGCMLLLIYSLSYSYKGSKKSLRRKATAREDPALRDNSTQKPAQSSLDLFLNHFQVLGVQTFVATHDRSSSCSHFTSWSTGPTTVSVRNV